jgi:hypothetical protein
MYARQVNAALSAKFGSGLTIEHLHCCEGRDTLASYMPLRFLPFILRVRISILFLSAMIQLPSGLNF